MSTLEEIIYRLSGMPLEKQQLVLTYVSGLDTDDESDGMDLSRFSIEPAGQLFEPDDIEYSENDVVERYA